MSPRKSKSTAAEQDVSKEEMNELEQALGVVEGGADSGKGQVRAYDFAHPEKLSKPNVRALEMVFADTSRLWTSRLSSALRSEVTVEMKPLEQTHLGAYAETTPAPRVVFAVSMDPLAGTTMIDLPAAFALSALDRMAGGKGELVGQPRPLSKIERNVVKRLAEKLAVDLAAAWAPVASVRFAVTESHDAAAEIGMDAAEPILVAASVWTIGSSQYEVNLIVPINSLHTVLDSLDPQTWLKANAVSREGSPESVAGLLKPVSVVLTVQLGRATLSVKEALNLEAGDVVILDANVHDALVSCMGDRPAFYVRPGLVRNRLSVQIVGRAAETSQSHRQSADALQTQSILGAA